MDIESKISDTVPQILYKSCKVCKLTNTGVGVVWGFGWSDATFNFNALLCNTCLLQTVADHMLPFAMNFGIDVILVHPLEGATQSSSSLLLPSNSHSVPIQSPSLFDLYP